MPVDIISRTDWGARAPKRRSKIPTPTRELWLHHTAGNESGAAGMRKIQNFHMDGRGWSDIAYSFVIDPETLFIYEARGAGVLGGHTFGRNSISHAICVMGNFDRRTVPPALVDRIAQLAAYGHRKGWWPKTLTGGHRDVRSTSCPGDNLYRELAPINVRTRAILTEGEDPMKDQNVLRLEAVLEALGYSITRDGNFDDREAAAVENIGIGLPRLISHNERLAAENDELRSTIKRLNEQVAGDYKARFESLSQIVAARVSELRTLAGALETDSGEV